MEIKTTIIWPLVLIGFWLWVITPSKLMGTINPVVADVQLNAYQDDTHPEWLDVSGSFLKLREECRPLRIDWVLGSRILPGPPIDYVWGKPEVRLEGEQVFEFWRVRAAPPSVLLQDTFADVIHKCGFVIGSTRIEFPWETRSAFWN